VRSIRLFAALSNKRIRVDPTPDDVFETALFASAALPVRPQRPTCFARGTGGSNPSPSAAESVSPVNSAATVEEARFSRRSGQGL
jgi:hypothetical protein